MANVKLLVLRSLRDAYARRNRLLAVILIMASGMAMYTGVYSAIESLFQTRNIYYEKGNIADLEIRFIADDELNIPKYEDIIGIRAVERRLLMQGSIELPDSRRLPSTTIAFDLSEPQQINRLTILEGHNLDVEIPNQIVVDRGLAAAYGYTVGDSVTLKVGKAIYKDLVVRGIATSPEYLIASADPTLFIPSKGSMGVIFVALSLVQERLGFNLINSLVFEFQAEVGSEKLIETILERSDRKLAVRSVIPTTEQFGYLFLNVDLEAFSVFVPVIIMIFTITSIIVVFFILSQWITSQRQEIGLLMALGYSKRKLVLAYAIPVFCMFILAVLIGWLLSFVTLYGFGTTYANAIGLYAPVLSLKGTLVMLGVLGVAITALFSAIFPLLTIMKLTPQDAVRGVKASSQTEVSAVMRYLLSIVKGQIWLRYAARNLLRGGAITVVTVFSIALALGVSISYFVAMSSFKSTLVEKMQNDTWNMAVDFISPLWTDELGIVESVNGINAFDPYVRGALQILGEGQRKGILINGIDPVTSLRHIKLEEGELLGADDYVGILLESKLASELGYRVGDEVTIDGERQQYTASLKGVFSGVIPGESYAHIDAVREWLDLDQQVTGILFRTNRLADDVRKELLDIDHVARVTSKSNVVDELLKVIQEAMSILYLAEFFSIAVAALFVYSSTSFMIIERKSEYGVLRILGFGETTIVKMITVEIAVVGLVGATLAVPVGYFLAEILTAKLSQAWFKVDTIYSQNDVLVIILPAIFLFPFVAFPTIRTINRIPLPRLTKEKQFG